MRNSFDYINGEKVDLTNQKHRDIVIQRNKTLGKALKNGVTPENTKVSINVTVEIECLKCGNHVSETDYGQWEFEDYDLERNMPTATCQTCKTRYIYNSTEYCFDVFLQKEKIRIIET